MKDLGLLNKILGMQI